MEFRWICFTLSLLAVFMDFTLATVSFVAVLSSLPSMAWMCMVMILIVGMTLCQLCFVVPLFVCMKRAGAATSFEGVTHLQHRRVVIETVSFVFAVTLTVVLLQCSAVPRSELALMISCVAVKFLLIAPSLVSYYYFMEELQEHRAVNERKPRELTFASAVMFKDFTFEEVAGVGSGSSYQKNCCICLEDFALGDGLSKLPCKHVFHRNCLTSWAMHHNSCPLRCELFAKDPEQDSIFWPI